MSEKLSEFNDDSLRKIAKEIIILRTGVTIHLFAFIFVNAILFGINLMTINGSYLALLENPETRFESIWHFWALIPWGAAMTLHLFSYFTYRRGTFRSLMGKVMGYHLMIYLVVNLLLCFINWFVTGGLSWVFWPIGCWGCLLIIHLFFYSMNRPREGESVGKSWIDRQIDQELKKVAK